MKNTLTIKECADFIGKSAQAVRIGLQRGNFKFGTAIQTVQPTTTKPRGSWDYHIQLILQELADIFQLLNHVRIFLFRYRVFPIPLNMQE